MKAEFIAYRLIIQMSRLGLATYLRYKLLAQYHDTVKLGIYGQVIVDDGEVIWQVRHNSTMLFDYSVGDGVWRIEAGVNSIGYDGMMFTYSSGELLYTVSPSDCMLQIGGFIGRLRIRPSGLIYVTVTGQKTYQSKSPVQDGFRILLREFRCLCSHQLP